MTHLVIIGLGAGGYGAMMAALRTDFEIEITVVEKRTYHLFSPCGIPYAIEGVIDGFEGLKHHLHFKQMNVNFLLQHEAIRIEPDKKHVIVKNLIKDIESPIQYDSLIIATGASPFIPPIEGTQQFMGNGIYSVRTIEDGVTIVKACETATNGLVVGGGAIGLEVACGLKARGLAVSIVEAKSHVLPLALDPNMAKIIEKHLDDIGIKLYKNIKLTRVDGNERIESATIGDEVVPTDLVVISTGVRADWDLAKESGVKLGRWGVLTDMCMRTNLPGIFAVGDVAETVSIITHRPTKMQLAGTAYKQGFVAGTVAAGGYTHYYGATNTWVSVVGGLEIAATGLNTAYAEEIGFKVVTGFVKGMSKPDWFPGGKELRVKVLADAEDGRMLGAQAIGWEAAVGKIEIVAMAIKAGLTVYDIANAEMAYCPAVSQVDDPLPMAAQIAVKKLRRKGKFRR